MISPVHYKHWSIQQQRITLHTPPISPSFISLSKQKLAKSTNDDAPNCIIFAIFSLLFHIGWSGEVWKIPPWLIPWTTQPVVCCYTVYGTLACRSCWFYKLNCVWVIIQGLSLFDICLQLFWENHQMSGSSCLVFGYSAHIQCSSITTRSSESLHAIWYSWTEVRQVQWSAQQGRNGVCQTAEVWHVDVFCPNLPWDPGSCVQLD